MITRFLIISILVTSVLSQNCNIRETDEGSVCVCNTKYCDVVPELQVSSGMYQLYTTSKARLGFYSTISAFVQEDNETDAKSITVNQANKYQTIIGFGGSFTDSAGININSLPEEVQNRFMESYFGSTGIEYSLCRVPIGGTDFSTRGYTYDDVEDDVTLEHFALQEDDLTYKIPFIQQANALRGSPVQLFASAWSAPIWMKTNHNWSGVGSLIEDYYQIWADYIIKFFEEYEKHNVTFWGMTTQNEPVDGYFPRLLNKVNAMGWSTSQMNKWIGENMGPTLRNSKFKDLKLILHDDSRYALPLLSRLLSNETTMSYADGGAVHWYTDFFISANTLDILTSPDKENWFFISSEACSGYLFGFGLDKSTRKGSWKRGEDYINDILENLEHGASGWVDWNMALDENGGPTYVNNFVDSPILINGTLQEFYKQPMFYAMGHFSKFAIPGSVRIDAVIEEGLEDVKAVAFLRPDNLTALTIFNSGDTRVDLNIQVSETQKALIQIEARSINTMLFEY